MNRVVMVSVFAVMAYLSYKVIKDAWERPPEEIRGPDPDDPVACSYWDLYGEP